MKKIVLAIFISIAIFSCDPDVPGEGITLAPLTFAFKLNKDTSYLKVGDTLNIRAALNSTINNIKLIDGEGEIWASVHRGDNIPQITFGGNSPAIDGIDYNLVINNGGVKLTKDVPSYIIRFSGYPNGDSIIMDYSFVFIKPGLYYFGGFQSSFYSGSKGKGRWSAYFNVPNTHWDKFWQVDGYPTLQPGDDGYYEAYWVAVTE